MAPSGACLAPFALASPGLGDGASSSRGPSLGIRYDGRAWDARACSGGVPHGAARRASQVAPATFRWVCGRSAPLRGSSRAPLGGPFRLRRRRLRVVDGRVTCGSGGPLQRSSRTPPRGASRPGEELTWARSAAAIAGCLGLVSGRQPAVSRPAAVSFQGSLGRISWLVWQSPPRDSSGDSRAVGSSCRGFPGRRIRWPGKASFRSAGIAFRLSDADPGAPAQGTRDDADVPGDEPVQAGDHVERPSARE